MAIYQFLDFTFCATTFALTQSGKEKPIRPKTAQALLFFLTQPEQLISKHALFKALWQSEDVQDYRLFQVISELRKLAPEQQLIRTQPNQGYIWQATVTQVTPVQRTQLPLRAIAAGLTLMVSTITSAMWVSHSDTPPTTNLLPAMSSYSNALIAFQKSDLENAEKWLNFSLQENPDSIEAQLLLAEVKLHKKELTQANQLAFKIINQTPTSDYYRTQALDLLSRISLENSEINDALNYAIESKALLNSSLAVCSSEVVNQRIATIITNKPATASTTQHNPVNRESLIATIVTNNKQQANTEQSAEHLALCHQLNQPTSFNFTNSTLHNDIFGLRQRTMRT